MTANIVKFLVLVGLVGCLTVPAFAQTITTERTKKVYGVSTSPSYSVSQTSERHVKQAAPTIKVERIRRRVRTTRPTLVVGSETRIGKRQLLATTPLHDDVDPRKYGFRNLREFKAAVRKSLGLPSRYPIYISEKIDYKYGRKVGLLVSGPSPQVIDRRGKPLTMIEVQRRSRR